jgi:hypothetical protein
MSESKSPGRWDDRLDVHNTNINEAAAREGRCGTVHLPTGWMCQLPALHDGACQLTFPDPALPALPGARGQVLVGAPPSPLAGAAMPEVHCTLNPGPISFRIRSSDSVSGELPGLVSSAGSSSRKDLERSPHPLCFEREAYVVYVYADRRVVASCPRPP